MAAQFTKGQTVQYNGVMPVGPVLAFRMEEDGTIFCLVEWLDADGNTQQRWFPESELIAVS